MLYGNLPLTVDGKVFILHIEFDKRLTCMQTITTVQRSRIKSRISWRLYITCLQTTITKFTFTIWSIQLMTTTKMIEKKRRWLWVECDAQNTAKNIRERILSDVQVLITLAKLLHVDSDKVPDVGHILNKLPFVVRLVNQMKNMSAARRKKEEEQNIRTTFDMWFSTVSNSNMRLSKNTLSIFTFITWSV